MKLLCLTPTYGRPIHIIRNLLANFMNQKLDPNVDAYLFIYDDWGNYPLINSSNGNLHYSLVPTAIRHSNLPEKYNAMIDMVNQDMIPGIPDDWDIGILMDDDDLYLEHYLQTHMLALIRPNAIWSQPHRVWSLYDTDSRGLPIQEPAAGRFHGSIGFWRSTYEQVGGWTENLRADFDQNFISKLQSKSEPSNPLEYAIPQYVFRWASTQSFHCQGRMSAPENETWYNAPPQENRRISSAEIYPMLDSDADVYVRLNKMQEKLL